MRTTLTLDQDVSEQAKKAAARLNKPFKQIVNAAMRIGLAQLDRPPQAKPFRYKPHDMGRKRGVDLDNVQELIAQIEGETAR